MAKRRNVQQQNAEVLAGMLEIACRIRRDGLPQCAQQFLSEHGIDLASSAVVYLQTAGYMLGLEHGLDAFIVTNAQRIWALELEFDASAEKVVSVIEFADVTQAQNLSKNNPGTGWGWGALALEVLRQLDDV